ncbi:MAG: phosphate acyltransferase PlsX [Alphaproteobacteria bacterium]
MSKPITIALDAMGGDFGPEVVVPAANIIGKEMADVEFLIYGDESKILPVLSKYRKLRKIAKVIHTDHYIANDEKPSNALRSGKNSSMRLAIEAVKDGKAQAAVSAGNTGALMAMAKIVLKTLPGIHRPAIASVFPTMEGSTIMLDLGANVLVDAENLAQFAVLGAAFAKAHKGVGMPSVGLLNVGTEETKGPDHVKGAAAILSNVDFPGHYKGFVEGTDIAQGTVDVIVCDGYAGNIALKTAEGVGKMTGHFFKEAIGSDLLAKLGGLLAMFALKRFKRRVDPRRYNGGVFLGLNGLCIKSHGSSDALGFSSAIGRAVELARHGYIETVGRDITHLMSQETLLSEGSFKD